MHTFIAELYKTMRDWLTPARRQPRQRRQSRLAVEYLEDRTVPADLLATDLSGVTVPHGHLTQVDLQAQVSGVGGQTPAIHIVQQPAHGYVTENTATGRFDLYAYSNYAGADGFTFRATVGSQDSNVATVSFDVTDQAPVAADPGGLSVPHGHSVDLHPADLVTDADGDAVTLSVVQGPAHGYAYYNTYTGLLTYGNYGNFVGTDTFTIQANDGVLDSNVATLSIAVTDTAPVLADPSTFTVRHDHGLDLNLASLASDADHDGTTISVVQPPTHGSLYYNYYTGLWTYTPNIGFVGTDSATLKANDGALDSNVGTLTITVTDQAPTVSDLSVTVLHGHTAEVNLAATASDPDSGDWPSVSVVQPPAHGSLYYNYYTGLYHYTPNYGFVGADTATYQATDGALTSNLGTATFTVTDTAPTVQDFTVSVLQGQTVVIDLAGAAADADSGDWPSVSVVQGPSHGYLYQDWYTGQYHYQPYWGYAGADSVTFKATDGALDSNIGTVTIDVTALVSLTNPGNQSNRDGDTVALTLTAADALGHPLSFAVTGLPPGLTMNSSTGDITGYLGSAAVANNPYTVTVTATDAAAMTSASQTFGWVVYHPGLWTGGGDATTWNDPLNWSGHVLPGSADDVTIGAGFHVHHDANEVVTVRSLTSASSLDFTGTLNLATASRSTAVFNFSGNLNLGGGVALDLTGGGQFAGFCSVANNAELALNDGTFNLLPGVTIAGGGVVVEGMSGGQPIVFVVGNNVSISNIKLGRGSLEGPGNLIVTNLMDWTGGSMMGTGSTQINGTLNVSLSTAVLYGRTLNNNGSMVITDGSTLTISQGAQLTSSNSLEFQGTGSIAQGTGLAGTIFNNAEMKKIGAANEVSVIATNVVNNKSLEVSSGTLTVTGMLINTDGILNPVIDIAADSKLQCYNLSFAAGKISGLGELLIQGNQFNDPSSMVWTGGLLTTEGFASGITVFSAGARVIINGVDPAVRGRLNCVNRNFDNYGTVQYVGGRLFFEEGLFRNLPNANFLIEGDFDVRRVPVIGGLLPRFFNAGTLEKTKGEGVVDFRMDLTNSGRVLVDSGSLELVGDGTYSGNFHVNDDADLDFGQAGLAAVHTFAVGATITGTGLVSVSSRAEMVLNQNVALRVEHFLLTDATVRGPGQLSAHYFDWTSGTMKEGGTLLLQAGDQAEIGFAGTCRLDNFTISNFGVITWLGNRNIIASNGVRIINDGSNNQGRFYIQNGQTLQIADGQLPNVVFQFSLINGAVLEKQGSGTTTIQFPVLNQQGIVRLNGLDLLLVGGYDQQFGQAVLGGGALTVPVLTTFTGLITLGGGTLRTGGLVIAPQGFLAGPGTVIGDVTNNGQVTIGQQGHPGMLNLYNSYTQGVLGTLTVGIGGRVPGFDYDQLWVAGNVTLQGTLNLWLLFDFQPIPFQDRFLVVQAFNGEITGQFDTLVLFPPAGNLTWLLSYTGLPANNSVTLYTSGDTGGN